MSAPQATGIWVRVQFFPLAFLFLMCTPKIVINGVEHSRYWGTHWFDLPPGNYTVKVYFRYLFVSECGANYVQFPLPQGAVRTVSFYMWPWIYGRGSMTVE